MSQNIKEYLTIVLANITSDLEKLLKGKLIYNNYTDKYMSIKLENGQTIIVDFKNKPKFRNVTGSAIMQLNSFSSSQINYLQALYNQYSSVNHTISIVSKRDYKPIKKETDGTEQLSIYDYNDALPNL